MKKILLACTLVIGSLAHADINAIEKTYSRCANDAESNLASHECAREAIDSADALLQQIYSKMKTPLKKSKSSDDKEILNRMLNVERTWADFRAAKCDLQGAQMLGGSGEGLLIADCIATMTIERVRELNVLTPAE